MTASRRLVSPAIVLVLALVAVSVTLVPRVLETAPASADVHGEDSETRYREVWVSHQEFAGIKKDDGGTCRYDDRRWFAEPTPGCGDYPLGFELDAVAGTTRAEVFLDIWRGRSATNVKFRVNDSVTYRSGAGDDWSRTPALREIAVGDLVVGDNELILEQASAYHLHDAAIRLYDLPGSYPDGDGITNISPAPSGGSITVDSDETITLTADVTGADAVEFIAYYDGFDENNDGEMLDWHSFTRNNWHPGGVRKDDRPAEQGYGTIGHIGTVLADGRVVNGRGTVAGGVSGNTWTIEFDTSLIRNGSPLRFKVRALNEAGSDGFWAVDAPGGATSTYQLDREGSVWVDYAVDPDFEDEVLHHGNTSSRYKDAVSREVTLDLSNATSIHMIGNYWEQPRIHINPDDPDDDDCGPDGGGRVVPEDWLTDVMNVTGMVEDGLNVICYEHVRGFGEFIENPGPLFVIRRSAPSGGDPVPTVDAGGPYDGLPGQPVDLEGVATDDDPITVRWTTDDGPGTVSFADDRSAMTTATFSDPGEYRIRLTADDGDDQVDDTATVTIAGPPEVDAGGPYVIAEGATADLDGTVDGTGPFTVEWDVVTGGVVTFGSTGQIDTTATAAPGEYTISLTADHDDFDPVVDEASLTVDGAPIVDAGTGANVVLPDGLTLDATVTDDGGATTTWSTQDGPIDAVFDDDSALATTVTFPVIGTYVLALTADDGINAPVTDTFTVQVFDAPPPDLPPIVDAGTATTGEVGEVVALAGEVTDDGAPAISWTVVDGPGQVAFADSSAASTTATFDTVGDYELQLSADDGVNAPAIDTVEVSITAAPDDPGDPGDPPVSTGGEVGYWMGGAGGDLFAFGDAPSTDAVQGSIVAMATTPDGDGLWVLTDDGVVHASNGAEHFGDVDLTTLTLPGEAVASLSVLPDGDGYWVFTDRGRAIAFGAAPDLEDLVDLGVAPDLNGPVVGSSATPTGAGAFMVAADGGVFAVGDAVFVGSMGAQPLNAPVVGIVPDPDLGGYWLVAADGGIFAFEAVFQGSMGAATLNAPVVGAIAFGDGYLLVAADGGLFNFSDQQFLGSLGDDPPDRAVRAVAGFPG
ncbi:MAG: PKD domain-containing protein [Actinomycetota bacterium]